MKAYEVVSSEVGVFSVLADDIATASKKAVHIVRSAGFTKYAVQQVKEVGDVRP